MLESLITGAILGEDQRAQKLSSQKKLEGWSINKLAEQTKGDSNVC
jgi:hypothetical protein